MGALLNGLSLVKVRPFGSGFFIFAAITCEDPSV